MSTEATAQSHSTPTTLRALLEAGADASAIAEHLKGMPKQERYAEALGLTTKRVGMLYDACAGAEMTGADFVPEDTADGDPIIHQGRNSLPMFNDFQKRFARMSSGEIVGYNHQAMAWLTGPGYFVLREAHPESDVPEELYLDYTSQPETWPEHWPTFKANDSGLSNLVYKNMKDYMRLVAEGVSVGKAYKLGKSQDQFFILCRQ